MHLPYNLNLFKNETLSETDIENFTCPYCRKCIMTKSSEIEHFNTKESQAIYEEVGEPESLTGYFSVKIRCTNPKCNEEIIVSGSTIVMGYFENVVDKYSFEELEEKWVYETFYLIKYFSRPPSIIYTPDSTPKSIMNVLEESYSLFWVDKQSCVNKLRVLVEEILFEIGIEKTNDREALHSLIMRYKQLDVKTGEKLEAIKWAGNSGSHRDTKISREQVLNIYKILEVVLGDLYNQNHILSIQNSVAEINRRKSI